MRVPEPPDLIIDFPEFIITSELDPEIPFKKISPFAEDVISASIITIPPYAVAGPATESAESIVTAEVLVVLPTLNELIVLLKVAFKLGKVVEPLKAVSLDSRTRAPVVLMLVFAVKL